MLPVCKYSQMAFFQRTHKATMILQRSQLPSLLKIFYHLNSHLIFLIITYQIQNILEIKVNNLKGIENIPLKDIVQGILTNLYQRSSHTLTVVNTLNAIAYYSAGCLVTWKTGEFPKTLTCGTSLLEFGPRQHILTGWLSISFNDLPCWKSRTIHHNCQGWGHRYWWSHRI